MNKIETILKIEYNLKILYPDETIENQLKNLQKDINKIKMKKTKIEIVKEAANILIKTLRDESKQVWKNNGNPARLQHLKNLIRELEDEFKI